MEVDIKETSGSVTVQITGEINTQTSVELEKKMQDVLSGKPSDIVFDFEEVEYMSSAGIRVVMYVDEQMEGAVRLINVNEDIMDVFEMTGLVDVLNIEL